jgi:hypothetical protein
MDDFRRTDTGIRRIHRLRPVHGTLTAIIACLAIGAVLAAGGQAGFSADPDQQDTVRPAVGRPLQAAQTLIAGRRYAEALTRIGQADAVRNKTRYEVFLIEEMRGFAEKGAGDRAAAIRSFEAVVVGQLSKADRARLMQEIAVEYYSLKAYPDAIQWATRALQDGGTAVEIHTLLAQSYFLIGDYANAAREIRTQLDAATRGNRRPPEDQLVMLADCALQQKNDAGYAADLEQLVRFYPKKEYWRPLLQEVQRKPNFAGRLQLDLDRLKLATGTLGGADDYLEMAQLALADGLPGEAQKTLDEGYAARILGTGPGAPRQNRMREMAAKSAAEDQRELEQRGEATDGPPLVNAGLDYVTYGQVDKGIGLVENGIRIGGLKHPADAMLRLGVAYLRASQTVKGVEILRTVLGSDGTGDLARLWIIYANPAN